MKNCSLHFVHCPFTCVLCLYLFAQAQIIYNNILLVSELVSAFSFCVIFFISIYNVCYVLYLIFDCKVCRVIIMDVLFDFSELVQSCFFLFHIHNYSDDVNRKSKTRYLIALALPRKDKD